tara:strand:- start:3918 stop:4559 length:642 start_codon:yes stop_codon:yes gene_type:complete
MSLPPLYLCRLSLAPTGCKGPDCGGSKRKAKESEDLFEVDDDAVVAMMEEFEEDQARAKKLRLDEEARLHRQIAQLKDNNKVWNPWLRNERWHIWENNKKIHKLQHRLRELQLGKEEADKLDAKEKAEDERLHRRWVELRYVIQALDNKSRELYEPFIRKPWLLEKRDNQPDWVPKQKQEFEETYRRLEEAKKERNRIFQAMRPRAKAVYEMY